MRMSTVLAVLALGAPAAPAQSRVTSPEQAFGKQVGADYFLANYTQLRSYWNTLARESDRIEVEVIGKTSYGQPMVMAIISSPANLAERETFRTTSARLSHARGLDDKTARELARTGKAVVWIDAGMHATESVAAQNIIELAYRMCAGNDEETRRILDNVILLVCPANPDGMEMIANAYMATRRVGGIPVLYQRWIGHDNNRDYYASNQSETTAINRILYRSWHPQIVYNHHQTAPRGTIIFTPPFRDPFNYNVDPLVVRGIDIVAAHINNRFTAEGKAGVISRTGAPYSTWWNGGLRTTTYFHNMIGILTEVFGHPTPRRITQTKSRRLPYGDYPLPITTQTWHARQTIEYLQTSNRAILDYAARYKSELLFNTYQMGRNAIAAGSRDHWTMTPRLVAKAKSERDTKPFEDKANRDARAYVLPASQPDIEAVYRFANCLIKTGVEVHRATAAFGAGGRHYAAGSLVIRCDQPYRAHVRDMLEPQWHPDDLGTGGQPVRPYDSAGWTLAMQIGVEYDRVFEGLEGPFEPIVGLAERPAVVSDAGNAGWLLDQRDSASYRAMNRLLAAGDELHWLTAAQRRAGREWPAGTVWIARRNGTARRIGAIGTELGLHFAGIERKPSGKTRRLRKPRIGLFDVWGGNMATGWAQWVLGQFEFPVELVFGKRITRGDLRKDFDVLIFHTGLPSMSQRPRRGRPSRVGKETVAKLQKALPKFEDWSNIADRLVVLTRSNASKHIKDFVQQGGSVLGIGSQANPLIRLFSLPIRVGTFKLDGEGKRRATNRNEFFIPGSLVRIEGRSSSPLCYGLPKNPVAMFRRSPVFELDFDSSSGVVLPVCSFAKDDILASGWAIGASHLSGRTAVAHALVDKGNVYLFGPDVLYRGQPLGTFKLVFNAIFDATAGRAR